MGSNKIIRCWDICSWQPHNTARFWWCQCACYWTTSHPAQTLRGLLVGKLNYTDTDPHPDSRQRDNIPLLESIVYVCNNSFNSNIMWNKFLTIPLNFFFFFLFSLTFRNICVSSTAGFLVFNSILTQYIIEVKGKMKINY